MSRSPTNKPREGSLLSGNVQGQQEPKLIEIRDQDNVLSVAFLDEQRIVSSGKRGDIRRWRVQDGMGVGVPMNGGKVVCDIAVSQDGKWVVNGAESGQVTVWDAKSDEKVTAFQAHSNLVYAVDVSPDGTRIVTGSRDSTASVWSLSTGECLGGPWGHVRPVVAVKFSPDGRLIATATWRHESVRIYDSQSGDLLVDAPVQVNSFNESLAWASDAKQLFTLSRSGKIRCLDASTGAIKSQWRIHSDADPRCIALPSNGAFVAASSKSSVSFWDTETREQIGSVIQHTAPANSMAISADYDLVIGGGDTITLRSLRDILPSCYTVNELQRIKLANAALKEEIESLRVQEEKSKASIVRLNEDLERHHTQLSDFRGTATHEKEHLNETIDSLRVQEESSKTKIALLEETIEQLRDQLSESQREAAQEKHRPHETLSVQGGTSKTRSTHLEETVEQPHNRPSDSQSTAAQEEVRLNETVKSHHAQDSKIARFEATLEQLHNQFSDSQHTVDSLNETIESLRASEVHSNIEIAYLEQQLCAYCARVNSLAQDLHELKQKGQFEVLASEGHIMDRLAKFKGQCISSLEKCGDEELRGEQQDGAIAAYSTALLLGPSTPSTLLTKWAGLVLVRSSVDEALSAAAKFNLPCFFVYQAICEVLERGDRILEAAECFRRMQSELGQQDQPHLVGEVEWAADFKTRCLLTLEQRGDVIMYSASYEDAAVHYTSALTLDPLSPSLLIKRSEARAGFGSWEDSLKDADAVIELDPSSPRGYERKRVALFGARRYDEAIDAHSVMLQKLKQSPHPDDRKLCDHYVSPSQAKTTISHAVKQSQRDIPLVLINLETGRLCNKDERVHVFETGQKFKELMASITTKHDNSRIPQAVQQYFRYATFSHTWDGAEPTFQHVLQQPIHDLASSPTILKLVMFCKKARETGLRWAWSDTCCINKTDGAVLQESLTSMFRWYHKSALTIIHLKGVRSDSKLGALLKCLWNTRAWTLQEFFASRVIHFYTDDWELYLPHENTNNHKDSLVIMEEMAVATGVGVQVLRSLQPGPGNIRQKLCLAAARSATKPEDMAYSLFGIFDVTIPVTYGEGQQYALGRLLQEVLTRSGDVTILAWTGRASDYNSCLPAEIGVYREPASPYIPSPVEDSEMDPLVAGLRAQPDCLASAMALYDQVAHFQSPRIVSRRLSLPCIVFPLSSLVPSADSPHVYHATIFALGNVEIKTTDDPSNWNSPVLVHPWLQCLLDHDPPSEDMFVDHETEQPIDESDGEVLDARSPPTSHASSLTYDRPTRALRFFARLRQPFGALLLVPLSHREYKRVASDHPIIVRLLERITPSRLKTKMLDIL